MRARPTSLSVSSRFVSSLALILAVGCGASETREPEAARAPRAAEDSTEEAHAPDEPAPEATPAELAEPEPPAPPPEPPAPEPLAVVAGAQLGPIRIGMSQEELRALGLPESPATPRSLRFGPYRVWLDDDGVRRVEASMGDLERVRLGGTAFAVGDHIHAMRDAIGDCVWREGGGERYRCGDGALWVFTDHSLDPARYVIAVERP